MLVALGAYLRALSRHSAPAAKQGLVLLAIDSVTNITDYGFHIYVGRVLSPGDFAAVQTINAALLVVGTAFAVMEPTVARYTTRVLSEPRVAGRDAVAFRYYFLRSGWLGLALAAGVWFARHPVAAWLNVPTGTVTLGAAALLFAVTRPAVSGALQGQRRFLAFGLTRNAASTGRLAAGGVLVALGGGLYSVVAAFSIGKLLALVTGLACLGRRVWRAAPPVAAGDLGAGWWLSAHALMAYGAYMILLSSDLIWVNRHFPPSVAGGYAAAVLLRRALTVLPGAVLVLMFPRVVAKVTRRELPDALLAKAAAAVAIPSSGLTALYFVAGADLVTLTFGHGYDVGALPGWMGVAVLGFSLGPSGSTCSSPPVRWRSSRCWSGWSSWS